MLALLSPRHLYLLGAVICGVLIGTALYFQHGLGMEPCPLCIFQRVGVMAVGSIYLLAALINPTGLWLRLFGLLWLIAASLGGAVSARHVWLQSLPEDQVPACGPGLDYMMEVFPLMETLEMVFKGSGECAEVSWRFLGLSMPGWMLIIFAAFALYGLWNLIRPSRPSTQSRGGSIV